MFFHSLQNICIIENKFRHISFCFKFGEEASFILIKYQK